MYKFINKIDKELSAYTLAEMLIVLLIISIVLISIPLTTKKLFTVKETKSYHGRYECYWDDAGKLRYYYAKERPGLAPTIEQGVINGDKCEFTPPLTYPYIMIHAVGGGGAGGNLSTSETVGSPTLVTAYYDYLPKEDNVWSKWFVSFMNSVRSNSTLKSTYHIEDKTDDEKTVYPTNIILKQINLKYRKSGNAGQIASMFFPYIPASNKFYLYPGKGGSLKTESQDGEDGGNTVVQIVSGNSTCDKTDENASCNIIFARGGKGATVTDSNGNIIDLASEIQLNGGKKSDYGLSLYSDVIGIQSGFNEIIDQVNKLEAFASKVPANAGSGGNGANHYITNSTEGFYVHEFDNYEGAVAGTAGAKWESISKYVKASIYNGGSGSCTNKASGLESKYGGELWVKRSKFNVSTQCYPYPNATSPTRYYCSVGNMDRSSATLACKDSGRCANYRFKTSGSLYSTIKSNSAYRNPVIHINSSVPEETYMEIEEHIDSASSFIYCPSDSSGYEYGSTPCASKSTDFDNGICNATKGGDGAIVILW